MRDFTVQVYRHLLDALKAGGYRFQTFSGYLAAPEPRVIMLRHDVDDRKLHSLEFARIQHEKGIVGTYYFRMVPQSFDPGVIREIYDLGHEVGYHYEDMDFAGGNPHQAVKLFEKHLAQLREVAPINTICMHGSPRSRYDNRHVWKHYNYRDFGIIGEPYFDLNYQEIFYMTDTGRRWDGHAVSVRDKVHSPFAHRFHSTHDIIHSVQHDHFPEKVMMNFHPQRWTDRYPLWLADKHQQNVKNAVKYMLIKWRKPADYHKQAIVKNF